MPLKYIIIYNYRVLDDVDSSKVDIKVNKGKTEVISMTVSGEVFSRFSRTKVSRDVDKN